MKDKILRAILWIFWAACLPGIIIGNIVAQVAAYLGFDKHFTAIVHVCVVLWLCFILYILFEESIKEKS